MSDRYSSVVLSPSTLKPQTYESCYPVRFPMLFAISSLPDLQQRGKQAHPILSKDNSEIWTCSVLDCNDMWSVWHGSKLEKRLSGNKAEKQRLLGEHEGKAFFMMHCAFVKELFSEIKFLGSCSMHWLNTVFALLFLIHIVLWPLKTCDLWHVL